MTMVNFFQYRIEEIECYPRAQQYFLQTLTAVDVNRLENITLYQLYMSFPYSYLVDKFGVSSGQNTTKSEVTPRYLRLKYVDKSQQDNDLDSPILRHLHGLLLVQAHALAAYIQGAEV